MCMCVHVMYIPKGSLKQSVTPVPLTAWHHKKTSINTYCLSLPIVEGFAIGLFYTELTPPNKLGISQLDVNMFYSNFSGTSWWCSKKCIKYFWKLDIRSHKIFLSLLTWYFSFLKLTLLWDRISLFLPDPLHASSACYLFLLHKVNLLSTYNVNIYLFNVCFCFILHWAPCLVSSLVPGTCQDSMIMGWVNEQTRMHVGTGSIMTAVKKCKRVHARRTCQKEIQQW